jgi:hypothetical protein
MKITADWFTDHTDGWISVLQPRLRGLSKVHAMFVRPFEGLPIAWFKEHMAKDKEFTCVAVEDFKYPSKVTLKDRRIPLPPVKPTFNANMKEAAIPLSIVKNIESVASKFIAKMDVIYIDTDSSAQALEAMVRAFPYLKPGGVMVVTNYTHNKEHDARCPRVGIDAFLNSYTDTIKVLRTSWHVFIERRKTSLNKGSCYSEYFS